jgi:cytochrome c
MNKYSVMAAAFILVAISQHSMAAGDPKKGKDVFAEECGDCHSATPGKNKKGPGLFGVMGRKAGSVNDFSGYSEAMKQSEIAWSTDKVDSYISQPRKVVPGGKMKYDGLDDSAARADVIAYLSSLK